MNGDELRFRILLDSYCRTHHIPVSAERTMLDELDYSVTDGERLDARVYLVQREFIDAQKRPLIEAITYAGANHIERVMGEVLMTHEYGYEKTRHMDAREMLHVFAKNALKYPVTDEFCKKVYENLEKTKYI